MTNVVYNAGAKSVNPKVAEALGITEVNGKFPIEANIGDGVVELVGKTVSFTHETSDIEGYPLLKLHSYVFTYGEKTRTFQDAFPLSAKGITDKSFWLIHKTTKGELGIPTGFGPREKDPMKAAVMEQLKAYKASLRSAKAPKAKKESKSQEEVLEVENF
jgi:hypothetical protein